ncbi:ankyrin repeat domain-containing protein [Paenibacillus thiaminolyticus]|uniref:ankyrin repeat domain-containing protein n=1 Tax=Paenibacillus thiaminolyticus TaxID=49283 RepID=UPI0035A625B0
MNNRLIAAAGRGQTDTVRALIREGADINATDASGRTAVLAAVHGRHGDTVRALIELGADVNKQDQRRDNPLLHASAEGLLDMAFCWRRGPTPAGRTASGALRSFQLQNAAISLSLKSC